MAIFVGIKKAKILLTRPISNMQRLRVERCMSKYVMLSYHSRNNTKEAASSAAVEEQRQLAAPLRVWVPHPPTGIYYPKGQERVMEGIPNEAAASFDLTFWLRNTDGVDKPDPTYP